MTSLSTAGKIPFCENKITLEQARQKLAAFAATWHTQAEWEARARNIRACMLKAAGLSPLPARCDLRPIIWGRQARSGYTIENVAIEALPGFFVTGNLYRPVAGQGSFAGILCPHGHFGPRSRMNHDNQTLCAALAKMGAVVFAYDMVGYGNSDQTTHDDPNVMTLQIWDSMRALDFVSSLPGVDPKRLACTGASGGGTQTFLLAALDGRLAVSVPVVQISATVYGGCVCERGLPIHHSDQHDTDNAEVAALFAPKPMLVISDGKDWTQDTPTLEFPYIASVYQVYGARDQVENLHLANEGHDYGPSKRAGMYRFMAKHLGLNLAAVMGPDGTIDDSDLTVDDKTLDVFTPEHPRPAYALQGSAAIAQALKTSQADQSPARISQK